MHILWVHNSSSILLSQTFEFLNTSANYKDATGNMFVNAYWSWSRIYFLRLWRVWVVYMYIYIHLISYIVFCLFVSLVYHQKNIAVRGTCCGKTASQFADLLTNMLRTYHRKIWMVCYVAMCLVTVFFVSKLPAYSYKRIFKKSAKKTSKSLCSKSSLYCHDFKTKFRISNTHPSKKGYHFMASSHFLGLFFETKKLIKTSFNQNCLLFFVAETAHSFHMPKVTTLVIHPPWVGRPRIRRFLLSLGWVQKTASHLRMPHTYPAGKTNIAIEKSPCFLVNTIKPVYFPLIC